MTGDGEPIRFTNPFAKCSTAPGIISNPKTVLIEDVSSVANDVQGQHTMLSQRPPARYGILLVLKGPVLQIEGVEMVNTRS